MWGMQVTSIGLGDDNKFCRTSVDSCNPKMEKKKKKRQLQLTRE